LILDPFVKSGREILKQQTLIWIDVTYLDLEKFSAKPFGGTLFLDGFHPFKANIRFAFQAIDVRPAIRWPPPQDPAGKIVETSGPV